jgi:quinol monooxygenase YgiN
MLEFLGKRDVIKERDELLVMIKVIATPGSTDNMVRTINPILGSIRTRTGCLQCQIYQDSQNPEEMALLEEWESESAFAGHVGSKDYRYILEWMEMSATRPEITICKNPDYKGLKVIKDLLNVTGKGKDSTVAAGRPRSGKAS